MWKFENYSIKTKLIIIFIFFKVIPLLLLGYISILSFQKINNLLHENSKEIIQQSQKTVHSTTYLAIDNSIKALDEKSKLALEDKSILIAQRIANFLYARDNDLLLLSNLNISQNLLQDFFNRKKREIIIPYSCSYDQKKGWILTKNPQIKIYSKTSLKDNQKEFHKVTPQILQTKKIPIYKEITFYLPNGQEIYKISTIDPTLKDISQKNNTYLHAEEYFKKAKKLQKGEIYVSPVIGAYIPSPIIGAFTKEKAKQAKIAFEPYKYGYAGKENPVGKKFEGIIRFVTPVYDGDILKGYLTLALDHHHIMDFTDFLDPLSPQKLPIQDASKGNYAFLWNNNFECISHPRDYFIIGYDPKTGKKVPGWIDSELAKKFKQSGLNDLNTFLQTQPYFDHQSLQKKPNLDQLKIGQVGLDCRYLNFAPQCEGWSELVKDGGYGSFVIFWSNVWKLTVAAAIPYYTGDYGKSKIGFGFITIGANVEEFHKAATQTKEKIQNVLQTQNTQLSNEIFSISTKIYNEIKQQINHMTLVTIILIFIVVYIAILLSRYIADKINSIIIATKKLKEKDFTYKISYKGKDEFGTLIASFNDMAHSINTLKKDLERKIYTDDLTKLANRLAISHALKDKNNATLFLIDIDDFKKINDFYGSQTGNIVLKEFAKILQKFFKDTDTTIYRIGSDDFAILYHRELEKEKIKQNIIELQIYLKSHSIFIQSFDMHLNISFTCGIAQNDTNLLEKADMALNVAKNTKKLYVIYNKNDIRMNKQLEFLLWKDKIVYAIQNNNIIPYFQPIKSLHNSEEKKYEVLMRLKENSNIISPVMFLDIAKEAKLYTQLTRIIIEKAFIKLSQTTNTVFSINLSYHDIIDTDLVEFIKEKITYYNLYNKIVFEILETEEIEDYKPLIEFIETMRAYGVTIAIDDFGSGYSNFTYFSMIKPEFLKIDGTLISEIAHNQTQQRIVEAIVKFAHSLEIQLIAEYVSSKEILEKIITLEIDYAQGYYIGEPQPYLLEDDSHSK